MRSSMCTRMGRCCLLLKAGNARHGRRCEFQQRRRQHHSVVVDGALPQPSNEIIPLYPTQVPSCQHPAITALSHQYYQGTTQVSPEKGTPENPYSSPAAYRGVLHAGVANHARGRLATGNPTEAPTNFRYHQFSFGG